MNKIIVIGEIEGKETSMPCIPIEKFKKAYNLSKIDNWIIYVNDAQFIEALEVLCGEENIKVYLTINEKYEEISFLTAYNYLGDIYDIIDVIRIKNSFDEEITDEWIQNELNEYTKKYLEVMHDELTLKMKKLNSSEPLSYDEWVALHNEIDKVMM